MVQSKIKSDYNKRKNKSEKKVKKKTTKTINPGFFLGLWADERLMKINKQI